MYTTIANIQTDKRRRTMDDKKEIIELSAEVK
jgi:hypothetical protein